MKANEAPEKIYMTPSFGEPDNVLLASFSKSHLDFHRDIEYIRKDAFIEKACAWLRNYVNPIAGTYLIGEDVEKFRNYMEGE